MPFLATSAFVLQLTVIIVALLLTAVYALRVRSGRLPRFRPLPGIDRLRALFSEESESGRSLHVATGASRFSATGPTAATAGGRAAGGGPPPPAPAASRFPATGPTAETIAGLLIAQRVAEATTRRGGNV